MSMTPGLIQRMLARLRKEKTAIVLRESVSDATLRSAVVAGRSFVDEEDGQVHASYVVLAPEDLPLTSAFRASTDRNTTRTETLPDHHQRSRDAWKDWDGEEVRRELAPWDKDE